MGEGTFESPGGRRGYSAAVAAGADGHSGIRTAAAGNQPLLLSLYTDAHLYSVRDFSTDNNAGLAGHSVHPLYLFADLISTLYRFTPYRHPPLHLFPFFVFPFLRDMIYFLKLFFILFF